MLQIYNSREIYNRRNYPRYDFRAGITIKAKDPDSTTWYSGVSQNLSQTGISILHSKILIPEEEIFIKIPIFTTEEEMTIKGKVAWVGVDDLYDDSPFWVKAGIKFEDLGMDSKETILNAISTRRAEDGPVVKKTANRIDFVM